MARVLIETSQRMLDYLPPYTHEDDNFQALMLAYGMEFDRIDVAIAEIVDGFAPTTADRYLKFWEILLKLPVEPEGRTVEQRRVSVLAFIAQLKSAGQGSQWEENMTALLGESWSYEHIPADQEIEITVPYGETGYRAYQIIRLARALTPANTVITVFYEEGFILGVSQLGLSGF